MNTRFYFLSSFCNLKSKIFLMLCMIMLCPLAISSFLHGNQISPHYLDLNSIDLIKINHHYSFLTDQNSSNFYHLKSQLGPQSLSIDVDYVDYNDIQGSVYFYQSSSDKQFSQFDVNFSYGSVAIPALSIPVLFKSFSLVPKNLLKNFQGITIAAAILASTALGKLIHGYIVDTSSFPSIPSNDLQLLNQPLLLSETSGGNQEQEFDDEHNIENTKKETQDDSNQFKNQPSNKIIPFFNSSDLDPQNLSKIKDKLHKIPEDINDIVENFSHYHTLKQYQSISLENINNKDHIRFYFPKDTSSMDPDSDQYKHNLQKQLIFLNSLDDIDYLKMTSAAALNMLTPFVGVLLNYQSRFITAPHNQYFYLIILKYLLLNHNFSTHQILGHSNIKNLHSNFISEQLFSLPYSKHMLDTNASLIRLYNSLFSGYRYQDYHYDVELFLPSYHPLSRLFVFFNGALTIKDDLAVGIIKKWDSFLPETLQSFTLQADSEFTEDDFNNPHKLSIKKLSHLMLQCALKLKYIFNFYRLEISSIQNETQEFYDYRFNLLELSSIETINLSAIDRMAMDQQSISLSLASNNKISKLTAILHSMLIADDTFAKSNDNFYTESQLNKKKAILKTHHNMLVDSYPYLYQLLIISKLLKKIIEREY